jgi:adenylosuccinate synthase
MLNGVTEMIMMKADVLDQFDEIRICVGYEIDGEVVESFPYELSDHLRPIYVDLPGWRSDLTGITRIDQFPAEFSNYIRFIEDETGVPITIASVGPNRDQTIRLD